MVNKKNINSSSPYRGRGLLDDNDKRKIKVAGTRVKNMLKEGLKPSQIARILNVSVVEVYKAAS